MSLYPHVDATIWLRTCKNQVIRPLNSIFESGEIPKWLNGQLFRNGPGASEINENLQFGHMFDNFGLIHCFTISNGDVTYQCRFVNSEYYKKIQSKRVLITDFGTKSINDPCNTIFHRVKSLFNPENASSDNAMITIYPFGDEMYAFGESPIIHRINKRTLATEKRQNMYQHVGVINHSAHPHIDYDGSVYNIGVAHKRGKLYHYIVKFPYNTNSEEMFENAEVVAAIPCQKLLNPSYMHSFGITQHYFILVQQPLSVSIVAFAKNKLLNEPLIGALHWDDTRQTRFDVIDRQNGRLVKSFYTKAFFFLHIINQYERESEIIIDICCYDDPKMINCMYTEALKNMQTNPEYAKLFRGRPMRFILDLNGASTATVSMLCNIGCETPQINYKNFIGKCYRYFYAINSDVDVRYPGTIIKVDVQTGYTLTWCEDNCYPSEPIFVANEGSSLSVEEDDGILIASLVWGQNVTNFVGFLVLNAKTMQEIGRKVFRTPSAVPKCLHGWFKKTNKSQYIELDNLTKKRKIDSV